MRNTGLEEAQAGIKIVRRNINNLRYADDTIANICWIMEKAREFQKNIYFCFIDHAKVFDSVDYNKLEDSSTGKFLKSWKYQTILPASWEICMKVKKQQLEVDMEQETGSKSGKE